jgi:hypothetical protein
VVECSLSRDHGKWCTFLPEFVDYAHRKAPDESSALAFPLRTQKGLVEGLF